MSGIVPASDLWHSMKQYTEAQLYFNIMSNVFQRVYDPYLIPVKINGKIPTEQ